MRRKGRHVADMPTLHYQIVPPGEVREDGGIIFFPRVERNCNCLTFSPPARSPREDA